VEEEISPVLNEAGFQDVSDDDILELLEFHSLPLMIEEVAELKRQTHKEAQVDLCDESVISEEDTLTIKRFKRNLQQN
jgi:hypothetical protein